MDPSVVDENIADEIVEFLFKTTKYHDCHFAVGDPTIDQVEKIGVSTVHLVSHSTVFRSMLGDTAISDPEGLNTHITDFSPEVFKLMLRHIYGGQLPEMCPDEILQLALCADKYNIQALVSKTSTMLIPESVPQVFSALFFVTHVKAPLLESHVTKFIQIHTKEMVACKEFLDLDDLSVEFIAKQDQLAIGEIELWQSVLKWAKNKTTQGSEMRQIMNKPLKHIRFLTFNYDHIISEVIPSSVFSSDEIVDILKSIKKREPVGNINICTILHSRAPQSLRRRCYQSKGSYGIKIILELDDLTFSSHMRTDFL